MLMLGAITILTNTARVLVRICIALTLSVTKVDFCYLNRGFQVVNFGNSVDITNDYGNPEFAPFNNLESKPTI